MFKRWKQSFAVKPIGENLNHLESWHQGALGKAILQDEQKYIDDAVANLYGFHLLQLGINRDLNLSRNSTIQHRFALFPKLKDPQNKDPTIKQPKNNVKKENEQQLTQTKSENDQESKLAQISALADSEKLPLQSESVDVVLLHHALEFSEHPHQLLRETERIVIPRGYVLVVGFNPFSWFGLWKSFARIFGRGKQWRHHSLRLGRVVDWLRLLDFEPVKIQHGFYRWPIDHDGVIKKTQWMEKIFSATRLPVGAFYVILARKDVVAMTPVQPAWKKFKPIEGLVGASRLKPVTATEPMQVKTKHTIH